MWKSFITLLVFTVGLVGCSGNIANLGAEASPRTLEILVGVWKGELIVPGAKLPLVLNVSAKNEGISAALDSPMQNTYGLKVEDLDLSADRVSFAVPSIGGSFDGDLSEDGREITGEWRQGGGAFRLDLFRVKGEAKQAMSRPQHPKEPLSYQTVDVTFPSLDGETILAGTLTSPEGNGPFPSVVLISGSGPQDRDSLIFGHRYFAVIADYLTKKGCAVLRFDDRGVGASTGSQKEATTYDFASDADGAVHYLSENPLTAGRKVTLLGHSEGSVVALIAASRNNTIANLILLSGPMVPYSDFILDQVRALSVAAGASEEVTRKKVEAQKKVIEAAIAAGDDPAMVESAVKRELTRLGVPEAEAERQATAFASPWMMVFLTLDPRGAVKASGQPILALWGTKDIQVNAEKNAAALRVVASESRASILVIEGLNHLLQPADTGNIEEYGEIATTISPTALNAMAIWLSRDSQL
jgi:uncharacterized protein